MSAISSNHESAIAGTAAPPDTSLLRLANVLLAARWLIAGGALGATVLTLVIALLLPRTYTASTTFMPQSRRALNLSGAASGLAASLGLGLPTSEPSQSPAFYVELLNSPEILGEAVDTSYSAVSPSSGKPQSLADWLDASGKSPALRRQDAIDQLKKRITAAAEPRLGIVRLSVRTRSAALSKQVVEQLVHAVDRFNLVNRQSQAGMERRFVEQRLQEVQRQLRLAEDELQLFLQRNRDYRNSPDLSFQEQRLSQHVELQRQLYTSLAQSYEQARIDEVRDTPLITVIEAPVAPLRPDRRGLVAKLAAAFLLGAALMSTIAFVRAGFAESGRADSRDAAEFHQLRTDALADVRHPIRAIARRMRDARRDVQQRSSA